MDADDRFDVTGSGYAADGTVLDSTGQGEAMVNSEALRWCLLAGASCNDATLISRDGRPGVVGDPTEGAMLVVAGKAGLDLDTDVAHAFPRTAVIPFSSERQYMATLHEEAAHDRYVVFAKGAIERILALCADEMAADGTVEPLDRQAVVTAADDLGGAGFRVLATAMKPVDEPTSFDEHALGATLIFTGLQAMLDPPRADAAAAVRACHDAGIAVKMITGDHASTATAIAGQLGLLDERRDGGVLVGADLAALRPEEFPDAVYRASVFARVSPEQKLRLVEALQSRDRGGHDRRRRQRRPSAAPG